MTANTVTWWEFPARDTDAAEKFYGAVFGWTFDHSFPGYPMISVPGASMPMGAFQQVAEGEQGSPRLFTQVEDLEATLDRAVAAGGAIVQERTEISADMGWWAMVTDVEGREMALWTFQPSTRTEDK